MHDSLQSCKNDYEILVSKPLKAYVHIRVETNVKTE